MCIVFENPYEVMRCFFPKQAEALTEDARLELEGVLDFESVEMQWDGENVLAVDTINGDVLDALPLKEWLAYTLDYVSEQA